MKLPTNQEKSNVLYAGDGLYFYKVKIAEVSDETVYPDKVTSGDGRIGLKLRVKYTYGNSEPKNAILFGNFKGTWNKILGKMTNYSKEWDTSYRNGVLLFLNNMFGEGAEGVVMDNWHINVNKFKTVKNSAVYMVKYFTGFDEQGNKKQNLFNFWYDNIDINDIVDKFNNLKMRNMFKDWKSYEQYGDVNRVGQVPPAVNGSRMELNNKDDDGLPF